MKSVNLIVQSKVNNPQDSNNNRLLEFGALESMLFSRDLYQNHVFHINIEDQCDEHILLNFPLLAQIIRRGLMFPSMIYPPAGSGWCGAIGRYHELPQARIAIFFFLRPAALSSSRRRRSRRTLPVQLVQGQCRSAWER